MVQERPKGTVMATVTVELKLPEGVIVIVDVPATPGAKLTTEGFAEMEKFGALVNANVTNTE